MDGGLSGEDPPEPTGLAPARWARVWDSRALLLTVARRHGADAEDAEDAVQEAMLRAAEHPEIAEDRLRAWLVAVTIRLCMDGHRSRSREFRRWQRISARAEVQQAGQHLEDEVCERSEAAWVASMATELLPPRQAQALQLTAEGCDVQQVANQLGVRYRAAESLLARARRTVRTAVTASLGVLVLAWRTCMPTASNPIPAALASATAATMMIVAIPTVLLQPEQPSKPPALPPAVMPLIPNPDQASDSTLTPSPGPARKPTRGSTGPVPRHALPELPQLPVLPRVAPAPPSLGRVGPLTPQPLPELPAVPPLVEPVPPPLGRGGSVTPQPMPEVPEPNPPIEPTPLPELDLPALPMTPGGLPGGDIDDLTYKGDTQEGDSSSPQISNQHARARVLSESFDGVRDCATRP
ncbi:MAG: sigma-70 family RNA polymerase sigma factor [Pseudonocardiaceae bacterium]